MDYGALDGKKVSKRPLSPSLKDLRYEEALIHNRFQGKFS
jgi:hypothetical protein